MTPHEKAVAAVNARLERLQANLREAKSETAQRFLFQSLVVTIAAAEALNDYIRSVGAHAQRRHADLKAANDSLAAQHTQLLQSGRDLLEKLKANPTDRAIRQEIESAQQAMEAIQKTLRRDTNALQRELAPALAMIDDAAVTVRRFSEADTTDALKRCLKTVVEQTKTLYAARLSTAGKSIVDAEAWEQSAVAEIASAVDFYDAYARAGYQTILGLDLMAMVMTESPPLTADDAARQANAAVAARVKDVTARLTAS
jgi:hypothetical protein